MDNNMDTITNAITQPINAEDVPKPLRDIVVKAKRAWLRNNEVVEILSNFACMGLNVSPSAPDLPPSGSLFLFNRKQCRFFRKDGYAWKKKNDNKTVKEVHEKLKLGSKEVLNCYYAHAEDGMQRRCYWLLEGNDAIVLVHYLDTSHSKAARKQGWIQPRPIDPVTGQLPTAPPPAPAVNPMGARKVSLSFSAEPMVTSHSMTTMTASGSFTITTGHSMVPVAEFRMTSKDSVLSENNGGAVRDEPSAAEVLHGDDHGAPPSLPATQRITETMAVPLVGPGTLLPQSPFYTQQRDAGPRHAAPDSPSRVLHGFDPEVLGLNRGGALPGASGLRGDGPSSQQQHSTLTEAQASNLAVAYVARSLQQQGLMPSASFAQYQSQDGGDGGGRRGSQAAVSAFEL